MNKSPTWQTTLKTAIWAIFTGLFDSKLYEGLYESGKNLLYYILVFVMRLAMLVLFPVGIAVVYYVLREHEKAKAKAREKMALHMRPLSDKLPM